MSNELKVCDILEGILGITFKPSDLLRTRIPNSLMLMQAILALESHMEVCVDLAELTFDATVADLADALVPKRETFSMSETREVALTPIQTAYLLGAEDDIELGGQTTFIYTEASYDCSAQCLGEAIDAVLSRHDIFRYGIDLDSGVMRYGERQVAVNFHGNNISDECLQLRHELLVQARMTDMQAPLVSIHVLGEANAKLLAYFNMVVMDAGALYIFFQEVDAVIKDEPLPLAMPYAVAVSRMVARYNAEQKDRDILYWQEKIREFPASPVPVRRVMGTEKWSTTRYSENLDSCLVKKLERIADEAGASLSSLLLASCSAVVARWQNSPGLTCNVTVSRRVSLDSSRPVLGDFTSSMLVGVDVAKAISLSDLATSISQDMFEGLAHGSISGVEVMAGLMRPGNEQQFATAPVVFTSYLGGEESLKANLDYIYTQTAQVCLDMQAMPVGNGRISISWDVVPQYFPHASEMFNRLSILLRELADGSDALPLTDPETEKLVREYNDTKTHATEITLLDFVEKSVCDHPDHIAIIGRRTYTYRELWERSGHLASFFCSRGVQPGGLIIVEFLKHPDDIVAMVAALRVGAAYVPVAASLPLARRKAIRDLVPEAFLVTTEVAGREGANQNEAFVERIRPSSKDLAYIIFTSGSTGAPKGVKITHGGVVCTIADVNERYQVDSEDRIIGLSSLGFDLSVYDIFGTFAAGATLSMVEDERDADEILNVLQKDQITFWNSAPALMELALLRCEQGQAFDFVKTVLLSGDRIPASLPKRIKKVFPNADLHSLGGATEASIWSIHYPLCEDSLEKRVPYGYPLANQGIHILGYDCVTCPRGVLGDIWISGDGVAVGYAAAPELTEQVFREIPGLGRCYKTGDVGVFNHEGFVEFGGRKDRQVKIDGHRIELGEIESVLAHSDLVVASVALIAERQGKSLLVCAYIPVGQVAQSQVRAELAKNLPTYMIPQTLVAVQALPVTANGKLDQDALSALYGHEEPQVLTETNGADVDMMREVFERILGGPVSNLKASFFSLGGDSLRFQVLLREIAKQTGRRLRFRDVLKNPSVYATARLLKSERDVKHEDIVPLASSDSPFAPFPLTEMQMAYYVGRHQGFDLGGVGEHYYVESITQADILQIERALNQVVRRHDMLRAVFTDTGQQRILPEVPYYSIEVSDFTNASDQEVSIAVANKRDKLSHQCFDLGTWPLFHISALALPDGTHRLFFSVDMIIGDGASQRIFIRDLTSAYENKRLPDIAGSYRDYVLTIRELQRQRDELPFSVNTERLLREFPLGSTLPQCGDMRGVPRMRRLTWNPSPSMTRKLEDLACARAVSLSTIFLYAYAASLALFSDQGKVGINVTTYNRNFDLPGVQELFGDFTGIILVDFDDLNETNTLERIQSHLLEQMGEGRSGVKLLAEMGKRRGFSGYALAPFVFTSLLFGEQDSGTSILGSADYAISQTPQVLIDHQVMRVNGNLCISWDYVDQVLDSSLMLAVFDYFKMSSESLAKDGDLGASLPLGAARLLRNAWANSRKSFKNEPEVTNEPVVLPLEQLVLSEKAQQWLSDDFSIQSSIDLDLSLFDIGLDSLGFVQLVQRLQKETGRQLPLAQALSSPCLRTLVKLACNHDAREQASPSLTLLREGYPQRVIIMVHGGFGTVDIYRDLAVGSFRGAQVWGLRFDEFARQWPQLLSVEQIVSRYLEEVVRLISPEAQIVVVGWSLGGTLGHALATRLGNRCVGLVLLDSLAPGIQVEVGDFTLEEDRAVLGRAGVACGEAQSLAELWSGLNEKAEVVRRIARAFSASLFEDLGVAAGRIRSTDLSTLRTLIFARNTYQAIRCSTPTLIVVPDDGEACNHMEWENYVGRVRRCFVRGNHYSFVLGDESAPTIDEITKFVGQIFSQVEKGKEHK